MGDTGARPGQQSGSGGGIRQREWPRTRLRTHANTAHLACAAHLAQALAAGGGFSANAATPLMPEATGGSLLLEDMTFRLSISYPQ